MVGRKPSIPKDKIEEEVLKNTIHDDQFKLKGKNDEVWKKISSAFKDPNDQSKEILLPQTFYLMVRQDRNELKTKDEKAKGIVFRNVYELTNDDCKTVCCEKDCDGIESDTMGENGESVEENEASDSEDQTMCDSVLVSNKKWEFQVVLIQAGWECIKPKDNQTMQEGWGDFVMDEVWEKTKIPCCYNFDNHRIGKLCFFSTKGFCSECKSFLSIILINEPTDGDVYIEVTAENFKFGIPHTKCRRLAGQKRKIVKKSLLNEMPRKWQRKEAKKIMKVNDPNPPQLYPLSVLQKARSEAIDEDLGIVKMPLFKSLSYIKTNHQYGHHFRIIRYDPFCVCFWSPDQVELHNAS